MPALIETVDLTREFGDLVAVDHLNIRVMAGEIYGLLGPNGAGKTTTLRMLSGLLTPTSGVARILGASPRLAPMEVKAAIGYLTGDTALYARLKPVEILRFFGRLNQADPVWLQSRIDELVSELDMAEFLGRRCEQLSTGQRQRTAIARALVHDPKVLIFDEPTANLDVVSSQFILKRLVTEAERGKAVLLSTHHLDEAELVCHRIGVVHRGRLLAEGTAAELRERVGAESLTQAFLELVGTSDRERVA